MKPELRFALKKMMAADLGEPSCMPDLLGENILQNHLETRLEETEEVFVGYGSRFNAYPYCQYNGYCRKVSEKDIKTAVLENDFLKAVFLPEYGGRLWELWDKKSGRNLLYTNDVLRFSNLAVRNAWFSGGVEWNIGIIGHHPFTTDKLYTAQTVTDNGMPVLRMYEYERIRQVCYQMDFWLEEDSRFLNCRMRIVNDNSQVVPMYWWSNIAVPEYEDGRVIVPAEEAFTIADGAVNKVSIPVVDGIDVTNYKKIPKSVDYFFDIPDSSPKYVANVDSQGWGLLQMSTSRLRSRKLFSWGNNRASKHWQEFLTDHAGRYLEIQAGLGKTQYGCIPMAPHTAWEWLERYGAVQLSAEERQQNHKERSKILTDRIVKAGIPEEMETLLKQTRSMAKKPAELTGTGSGYGALKKDRQNSVHLEFRVQTDSLKRWTAFLETGVLHEPAPLEKPDEFLIQGNAVFQNPTEKNKPDTDQELWAKLASERNQNNWYAHYHLGLGWFDAGNYEEAQKEFEKSCDLRENPWAFHGQSCAALLSGDNQTAGRTILLGMNMVREQRSYRIAYFKEGFRILNRSHNFEEICRFYETLEPSVQLEGRLRLYYISALHSLGQEEKAWELLEENGGLQLDDIREGEVSVADLWEELYRNLYGEEGELPYQYDFRA